MQNRIRTMKHATALVVALSCVALSSIGGADSVVEKRTIADQELFFAPVPKAVCGPGDKPENALQGQVPAALRAAGFQGFKHGAGQGMHGAADGLTEGHYSSCG